MIRWIEGASDYAYTATNTGFGFWTSTPSTTNPIHVNGIPRIDNTGAAPNLYRPEGPFGIENLWGNQPDNLALGTPDSWLILNQSGNNYVVPMYVQAG